MAIPGLNGLNGDPLRGKVPHKTHKRRVRAASFALQAHGRDGFPVSRIAGLIRIDYQEKFQKTQGGKAMEPASD